MRQPLQGDQGIEVVDVFGRPLRNLRLSVTDRCNIRCAYCMPEETYAWLPKKAILTFEEIANLAHVFTEIGVTKVRLTGGEPLLRKNLPRLIRMLRKNEAITDLALTTNGVLLEEHAQALCDAGLQRITISLATLKPERFKALTRRDTLAQVLAGIQSAKRVGFHGTKLDTVVIDGYNDDELGDLIEYGKSLKAEVRFIEYMDVGGANDWAMDKVLSRDAILRLLTRRYGRIEPLPEKSSAPAQRFIFPDGTTFGIIPSTTTPFCATCDRSRVTADGLWLLCLYAQQGIDLRKPLRRGSFEDVRSLIFGTWQERTDRGAEVRKALESSYGRGPFIEIQRLREDPHLEMHARGG